MIGSDMVVKWARLLDVLNMDDLIDAGGDAASDWKGVRSPEARRAKSGLLREIGVKHRAFRMWALHSGKAILERRNDCKAFSYAEIADHYGVSRQYVCKVCGQVEEKVRAWARA